MNKKRKPRIFLFSYLLLLNVHSLGCFSLTGGCENEVLRTLYSPTKQLKAVVFQRECGATTGFSTQISILSANSDLPNESGNVFYADTDHGKAPSEPTGGPHVEVEWKGESSLNIIYDYRARASLLKNSYNGVTITTSPVK
jgi:hypothetical protein